MMANETEIKPEEVSNKEIEASCDSGFSTDADDFSDSEQTTANATGEDEDLSQEMPLTRSWTFYYLNNQSKNWDERIKKIGDFSTVEGFWRLYNHVKLPTHISVGCDLMIFQSDIEPKWENPANRQGGRLVAEMTKEHRNDCMSTNWLNTILGLIGEQCSVEHVASCLGVQFQSRRKMDKISMWVGSGHTKDEIKNLGAFMLDGVQNIVGNKVKYNSHESQSGKTTSSRRYDFCVAK
jgi:translation initiation factor 4E